jgi:hypothetical protein
MNQMLAKHWEKLVLGLSLALIAAYFIGAGMAKPSPLLPEARKHITELERELGVRPVDLPPLGEASVKVVKSFGPALAASPGDAHVYNRPPVIEIKVETAAAVSVSRTDPKTLPVFKVPVLSAPVVEPGMVKLAWSENPETKNVKVAGYIVYRKAPGAKEFEKLTPEPVADTTFTDSKIEPKIEYQYAVGAIVTDKAVLEKLSPPPAGGELKCEPVKVTTVGILDMELKGVAEIPLEPDQPPVPTAQLNIRKFADGRWRTKLYLVRKGDKMGDGDLATGCVVEDLARVMIQRTEEYVVNKFDDKGVKIGEEKKQRTREVQTWELKYKDEAGKNQKMYPVEKPATPAAPPPDKAAPATPGAAPKGPAVPSPIPGAPAPQPPAPK